MLDTFVVGVATRYLIVEMGGTKAGGIAVREGERESFEGTAVTS